MLQEAAHPRTLSQSLTPSVPLCLVLQVKGQLARCCVMVESTAGDAQVSVGTSNGSGKREGGSFTKEELKELFNLKVGVSCMTADQLKSSDHAFVDELEVDDAVLCSVRGAGETISFVFNERARPQNAEKQEASIASEDDLAVGDDF